MPASNGRRFGRRTDPEPPNAILSNRVARHLKYSSSPPLSRPTLGQDLNLLSLLPSGTVSPHNGLNINSGSQDLSNPYDYPDWSPSTTYTTLAPKYDPLGYDVPGIASGNPSETTSHVEEMTEYQPSGYDYAAWSPSTTYNPAPKYDLLGCDAPGFASRNPSETTSRNDEMTEYQPSGRIIRGDGTQRERLDPCVCSPYS